MNNVLQLYLLKIVQLQEQVVSKCRLVALIILKLYVKQLKLLVLQLLVALTFVFGIHLILLLITVEPRNVLMPLQELLPIMGVPLINLDVEQMEKLVLKMSAVQILKLQPLVNSMLIISLAYL